MLQEKEKLENELEEANRLLNAEREKILVKRREISNIKEQIAIKEKEILDLRKRLTDMEKRFEETIKLLKNKVAECFRGTIELLE
jgi:predicted  nucleic acid-binding Zn-ribbon protein